MKCNIDARGKAVRLKLGIMFMLVAGILGGLLLVGLVPSVYWWYFFGITIGGGFIIFEARSGWCVIRAMGFKTPF